MKTFLICTVFVLCVGACAPRHAATAWGYSHWYEEGGASTLGSFDDQQKQCLGQLGASVDPATVAPGSAEENAFLECMNAAGWCTSAFNCNKPGA